MQVTRRHLTGALAALPLLPMLGACGARREGALTIWAMGNEGANLPELLKTLSLPANMPPIEVQNSTPRKTVGISTHTLPEPSA